MRRIFRPENAPNAVLCFYSVSYPLDLRGRGRETKEARSAEHHAYSRPIVDFWLYRLDMPIDGYYRVYILLGYIHLYLPRIVVSFVNSLFNWPSSHCSTFLRLCFKVTACIKKSKLMLETQSYNDLFIENLRFPPFYPPQSRLELSQGVLLGRRV